MLHGYTHNQDDKAQLINDNLDVVKKIAFYYVGRVGKVVEVDDLLQLGMVGLIEAAHNYTPKEDVSFVSYAKLRIKGAIVDYLRKSSNLCRGTIRRKQDYERAKRKLEKELFREPEAHEIAKELNVYEIAEVLSVSTGRVSQIKSAAIQKLKVLIESQVNA